ncbi:putative COPII coat assembly protein SEC16 [Melia azedarach]|uniref:COPII coat assembly protein SEC16 n=1 Tax=Melia azedarach TaxID=155640 RepID=A0ACC1X267_MELAZ|nr:putative COPII coat assembly protein SEC16 [Melia azedarach]
MNQLDPPSTPTTPTPLRRRNSIATSVPIPQRLALSTKPLHTSSLPNGDVPSFELVSLKSCSSYTSLKDLIPPATAVNSPTAGSAANSGYEISIRNRLVKQAAWAYLQPMSASPDDSAPDFLRRIWMKFSSAQNSISSCLRLINYHIIYSISRAIDRILGVLRVYISR